MAAIVANNPKRPVQAKTFITSKAKGLQVVNAQLKKTATGTRQTAAQRRALAIGRIASSYRKSRLQAYQSTLAKYNASRRLAATARVAAFATRQTAIQSIQGHQNRNLQNRIFSNYGRHLTLLGRLQFAVAGQRKYVTQAALNTVTSKQATSYATYLYNLSARGLKITTATVAPTKQNFNARNGLPARGFAVPTASTRPTQPKTPKQRQAPASCLVAKGPRTMDWLGRPDVPDCVPVAVGNSLLAQTGFRLPRLLFRRYSAACGPAVTIPEAVAILGVLLRDAGYPVRLAECRRVPLALGMLPGYIIGYECPRGPHAALSLRGNRIVSWGQEIVYTGATEEAWSVTWREAQ